MRKRTYNDSTYLSEDSGRLLWLDPLKRLQPRHASRHEASAFRKPTSTAADAYSDALLELAPVQEPLAKKVRSSLTGRASLRDVVITSVPAPASNASSYPDLSNYADLSGRDPSLRSVQDTSPRSSILRDATSSDSLSLGSMNRRRLFGGGLLCSLSRFASSSRNENSRVENRRNDSSRNDDSRNDDSLRRNGFTILGTRSLGVRAVPSMKNSEAVRLKHLLLDSYRKQLAEKERLLSDELDSEEKAAAKAAAAQKAEQEAAKAAPPPLDADERAAVQQHFRDAPRHPQQLVVEAYKVPLTYADLATLRPRTWLNDNVIDLFLSASTAKNSRVHTFTTHFYSKLAEEGYSGVRRWAVRAKLNVFEKEFVFVPVNINQSHWTLAVVNNRAHRLEFYDSMPHSHGPEELRVLQGYLEGEAKRLGVTLPEYEHMPRAPSPLQENTSDCGVFVCENVRRLAAGEPLQFTQKHIPAVRERMASTLIGLKAAKL